MVTILNLSIFMSDIYVYLELLINLHYILNKLRKSGMYTKLINYSSSARYYYKIVLTRGFEFITLSINNTFNYH